MSELLSFSEDGPHTRHSNCILACTDGKDLKFHISLFYLRKQKYFIDLLEETSINKDDPVIRLMLGSSAEVNIYLNYLYEPSKYELDNNDDTVLPWATNDLPWLKTTHSRFEPPEGLKSIDGSTIFKLWSFCDYIQEEHIYSTCAVMLKHINIQEENARRIAEMQFPKILNNIFARWYFSPETTNWLLFDQETSDENEQYQNIDLSKSPISQAPTDVLMELITGEIPKGPIGNRYFQLLYIFFSKYGIQSIQGVNMLDPTTSVSELIASKMPYGKIREFIILSMTKFKNKAVAHYVVH